MSSTSFTFLNATGTPGLSQSDAKLMRAHITRTNFANRRQQLTKARTAKERELGLLTQDVLADPPPADLLLSTPPKDPYRYAQFLSRFWSFVFLDGGNYPSSPGEEAWIQLLVSEAALAEVSMAIGIRHWSPDASCQEKAVAHSCKAANIIIQHIKSKTAHASAILGAVLSMAIGERLVHNDLVWNIHVDGLANLITERRSQGEYDLPPVLCNFLILDSTNDVFSFPLAYHRKIIDAIRAYGSQPICSIANMSDSLVQLRKLIDTHRKSSSGSDVREKEIGKIWNSLLCQARSLRFDDNPFVQATSRAIELILYVSWCPQLEANLTLLASELKDALCRLPVRPCLFMDITSSQLMLGAVAAGEGSQIRAWFVARLRRAVLALRSRGWVRPLEILEKGFVSNDWLVASFRALWKELDS
ncbi:Uncharacterized protein BP5553_04805 [Venustampulla echinocandica]|uniref:Uncharacterized protein n=1 Tax=Venustampulla echinocandica TaxID=2656787 RepID=A0A370TPD2_9HELO|nr:Uncharacterized protein BP5553_04805 [Venustampulla echinocandica]RDL37372.1 Uncharacterized protein BP5553_04805 [Venustampulla echinocandica]